MSVLMIAGIGIFALVVVFLLSGYVKAPPDMAFIISGAHSKPRVLIGKAGFRVPFFERLDKLMLRQMSIDIKTNGYIPTKDFIGVNIDAVAKVRVLTAEDLKDVTKGITPEMVNAAMKNFLNMRPEQIEKALQDSLQGNMREIIGTQELKLLCTDRKTFGDEVQNKAQKDMNALGIWIESCNIQKLEDENNLITALGQDNMAQISKNAAIAKSNADREVEVAKAENAKAANDARVASQEEIAVRNNAFVMKQAELKQKEDTAKAVAAAAAKIEDENQRKLHDVAAAEADIARQEKEVLIKEKEIAITERTLDAKVKKQAEAEKYAAQQKADANLYTAQKSSEAKLYETQKSSEAAMFRTQKEAEADLFKTQKDAEAELFNKQKAAEAKKAEAEATLFANQKTAEAKMALAEAVKAEGEAEAAAIRAKGEAEAAATLAKAQAEAEGMLKKAEAMKQYGDAAQMNMQLETIQVLFNKLPEIAQAIGEGYASVGQINMYGGDSAKLTGDIIDSTSQIINGFTQTTGIDMKSLLAGVVGGKMLSDSSKED